MIKTYDKYKESGMNGLDKIPEDWIVFKIKDFFEIVCRMEP